MNYRLQIFFDNLKNSFAGSKKKALIGTGIGILAAVIILLLILCVKGCGSGGNKEYRNTMSLAQVYADKGEFDRALGLLDTLLIKNPDDKKVLELFDAIIGMKKESQGEGNGGAYANVSPNISVDFDTSELSSAMKSALDRQAEENQKALEKALDAQNRQALENQRQMAESQKALQDSQKKMADLMEKQAAQEQAAKQAEAERREAEKAAEAQRKAEEEKRRKAEEELAKKNEKLKKEIEAVNEQIRLGKTALDTGNVSEALNHFKNAKGLLPVSEGEPQFSASKESEMAQAIFDAAEKSDNDSEKDRLMSEAVQMAKNALKTNPKDSNAHNIIGTDALNRKDYNLALDEFKKAVQADPNNYLYYYNLGKTQYIMKKYSEAASSFKTCCKLNAQFSQGQYNLGLSQLKLKNDGQALEAFRAAISINPRYEKAYLEQARLLSKRGDNKGSVDSYKKVIEINNVNTTALMEMGSVYYGAKQYSLAEESYLKALSLMKSGSNYTLTCFNLSTVLFEEEKYTDAVSFAQKAYNGKKEIKDDKLTANIIYNYALLMEKNGKGDDAVPLYQEVLKYDPKHNKTKINLAVMFMSFEPADTDNALKLLQQVYESDKKNFEANNNLGTCYLNLEKYDEAVKFFKNALEIDGKNNEVRYNLAKAYARNGEYQFSKQTYLDVLKADTKNWNAYIELAKVCIQLSENAEAEKYLIYVQEKNPSFKKAEVQSLLDGISQ